MNNNDIPGIYNYCDRWCERCIFTSRCLTFKFGEMMDKHLDDKTELNQVFWKFFDKNLGSTLELFEESELEDENYLFEEDEDYTGDDFELKLLIAESQDAAQLAKEYINIVSDWFEQNEKKLLATSSIEEKNITKLSDSIDVIHWYHIFIYPKIMRALQGKEEDLLEDEFPLDSDGSAKIALIAIERSISAWGYIFMQTDDKNENIFSIIKLLVTLQHLVEDEFPNARTFIRPGFDEDN
ncbi:MAG: hypothetical protein PF445_02480 [Melioribacteraceae bacterium]|jgi:hypothetical protein|nr:hypothetical protein [Melioribacteraceae bacterium]